MLTRYAAWLHQAGFSLLLLLLLLGGGSAQAQEADVEITGQVTASSGGALPGVTILAKGTSTGTSTNSEGRYVLKVPTDATLVFSFVGYAPQTVAVGGRSQIDVVLAEDVQSLSDVVVVGYGTQRRQEVTGAISSVKAAELTQTPVANVVQGLQGRAAGVQITQNSAAPGGSISVRIRGTNSINGTSEPLYVIDGIQISNTGGINDISPLSSINPTDIESVEVLKDASATAIYGSLGANGVVLITTKRGKNGPTRVSYDGYYGTQQVNKKLDVLNASQFAQLENEIYRPTVVYSDAASVGEGVNWQDLIFRNAGIQNHQVTVAGGADKTQLALSLNYFRQDGIILNSGFDRYSVRLNLDHRISDRIKVGTSLLTSYATNKGIAQAPTNADNTVLQGVLGAALAAPPTLQPYNATGAILPFGDQFNGRYREVINPLGLLQVKNQTAVRRTLANVFADVLLVNNLTYRASFSADLQNSLNDFYSPRAIVARGDLTALSGLAAKTNTNSNILLHESILTYDRTFAEDHALKLTTGISNRGTFLIPTLLRHPASPTMRPATRHCSWASTAT
jgi:TonB-linked SusC/RagA family outer membrane protein